MLVNISNMLSHPRISQLLVQTGAYRDLDKPVILTSGNLGIYYINTEKLVQDDGEFAKYGDDSDAMIAHAICMMDKHPTFRDVIDILTQEVEMVFSDHQGRNHAVSGGQRRDWLFSGPAAHRLDIPHISLYKDGKMKISHINREELNAAERPLLYYSVAHISDLLTTGSSSYDARNDPPTGWVPMLRNAGAAISDLFTVVTRLQGGEEALRLAAVDVTAFIGIDRDFLATYSRNPEAALAYYENPHGWSENYIHNQGVDDFVGAFDPNKRKDIRSEKFLGVYKKALTESGRWDELASKVQEKYGIDINSLSYDQQEG